LINKAGLTSPIVAKFAKGEYVAGETIEKRCLFFGCQPSDIFQIVNDSK
jgi:DNA-binding Xre family transcriptional regulator